MKISQQSQSLIESTIEEAVLKYPCNKDQTVITDIHLQPNQTSGEFIIFDDEDNELASVIIEEWLDCDDSDFYKDTERILRTIVNRLKDSGKLDKTSIMQPYSFVLVDEDKETLCELLLVDNDVMLVNEELLKDLDKELDNFLKDLLEK